MRMQTCKGWIGAALRKVAVGVAVALLAGILTPPVSAAVLSGSLDIAPAQPADLTASGTRDWAVWDYRQATINNTPTAPPSNRKASVTPVIGSVTTLVGNARGTPNSLPAMTYSYSDGVDPVTLTSSPMGIVFDSSLNNTSSGLMLDITSGAAGVPERVQLFLAGFGSTPTLTVSLLGASDYINSDVTYPAGTRPVSVYTINFTPDHDGDLLHVLYQATSNNNSNANIDLQAVTVAVPEPASLGIFALGMASLLGRRIRRP